MMWHAKIGCSSMGRVFATYGVDANGEINLDTLARSVNEDDMEDFEREARRLVEAAIRIEGCVILSTPDITVYKIGGTRRKRC